MEYQNYKSIHTSLEHVVLDVPLGIPVPYIWIAGHLLLLESPFGQLLSAGRQRTALQIMHEHQATGYGQNGIIVAAVDD